MSAPITAEHELAIRLGPWDHGDGPLYQRLAVAITHLLETGQLDTGSVLPAERRLATALAVSRNTVTAAYAELRKSGWIDARQGSVTTVTALRHSPVGAHRANGLFATLLRDHPDVVDLTIAVPDAAPVVSEVLTNPAAHLDPGLLTDGHGYHPRGLPALRAALAEILSGNGLATQPDELLVTSGAQQAISLVIRGLVRPGDTVGVEEVSFPGALDAIANVGGRVLPLPLGPRGLDMDCAASVIARERPRLLYLVPTFHNPTGTVLAGPERRRLARTIAEHAVTTIDDITLAELDFDIPSPPPLAAIEPEAPIITVGGMSKVFWGGLRIGFVRARPSVIFHLAGLKATSDLGGNAPAQVSAVAMLARYDETRAWRNARLRESIDALGTALDRHLPEWEWERPGGGPHVWVRLPGTDAMGYAQLALRHGVATIAGPLLAARDGIATDRIRIPYYRSGATLQSAVRRLADAWRSRGRNLTA